MLLTNKFRDFTKHGFSFTAYLPVSIKPSNTTCQQSVAIPFTHQVIHLNQQTGFFMV